MDTDKVLEQFFAHCIEAGSLCVLNTQNQTAESLALNLEALYVALDQAPITISANATISVTKVTSWVFQQLYNERLWPKLATGLGLLYNGSYATFYNMTQQHESDTYNKGTEAIVGIKCGDSAMRFDNITEIEDLIAEQITISKWFPMSMTYEAISCGTWQMQAAGRYTGDLQVTTKTPVLFINNIYDNITPMANAYVSTISPPKRRAALKHEAFTDVDFLHRHGFLTIP